MMVTRQQIIYFGRVQGVGFRYRACSIARRYPVTGWVCNQPDGSVILEAQADESCLMGFLDDLRGENTGLIEREAIRHVTTENDESCFEIRHH